MKQVIAIIAGVVVGAIWTGAFEMLVHFMYPPPPEILDNGDLQGLETYIASLPILSLVVLLFTWLIAAMAGAFVAALIYPFEWKRVGLIVGGILLAFSITNMIMIAHPVWMMVAVVVGYPLAAYVGAWLVGKRTPGYGK